MANVNEKVLNLLNNSGVMLYVATSADNIPNVVPVGFKIYDEGNVIIGDILLNTTLKNIEKNPNIALSITDSTSMAGYQIKGSAKYVSEGKYVEQFNKISEKMFKGAFPVKGALIVTPSEVIVTTPGPKCGDNI